MDNFKLLNAIKEAYLENKNIIQFLKEKNGNECTTIEDILISYDFQAGTYIKMYENNPDQKKAYCYHLARVIKKLGECNSILEAGVGEATTLGPLLASIDRKPKNIYGFDIAWSRIKYARKFLNEIGISGCRLFIGDLFSAPLKDNSIDIVYTSHSIEPNGGREREALEELYRITNKYLILLEPAYELANEVARERMKSHGYITNLYETAKNLGYDIIEHRLFEVSVNSLNPTGLMIIKKSGSSQISEPLCCPITKSNIINKNNAYFSEDSLLAYPIIDDIPCLLPSNAIIATKFMD